MAQGDKMTIAEAIQMAIDNATNPKIKDVYRKWYNKMTIKQASVVMTKREEQDWLKKHGGNHAN